MFKVLSIQKKLLLDLPVLLNGGWQVTKGVTFKRRGVFGSRHDLFGGLNLSIYSTLSLQKLRVIWISQKLTIDSACTSVQLLSFYFLCVGHNKIDYLLCLLSSLMVWVYFLRMFIFRAFDYGVHLLIEMVFDLLVAEKFHKHRIIFILEACLCVFDKIIELFLSSTHNLVMLAIYFLKLFLILFADIGIDSLCRYRILHLNFLYWLSKPFLMNFFVECFWKFLENIQFNLGTLTP